MSDKFFASLDKIVTFWFLNFWINLLRNVSLTSTVIIFLEVWFSNFLIPCPLPEPISITLSFFLTLSFVIISQLFLVNKLHHYKSELTDSLNSCINNITDLSTIINDNHMINTLDMENTLVLSENDEMRYCSFPNYYLNKCFT